MCDGWMQSYKCMCILYKVCSHAICDLANHEIIDAYAKVIERVGKDEVGTLIVVTSL